MRVEPVKTPRIYISIPKEEMVSNSCIIPQQMEEPNIVINVGWV